MSDETKKDLPPYIRQVDIAPPPYKDPVEMLRNMADDIENEVYTGVETLAIAMWSDEGLTLFGGGPDANGATVHLLFDAGKTRMASALIDGYQFD